MVTVTRVKVDPRSLIRVHVRKMNHQRQKINAQGHQSRIKELHAEISGLNRHIWIKEQRQATWSHNFEVCDEVASEISERKSQRRELETELAGLQLKCKKAAQYQSRKKNATRQCDDGDDTTQSRSKFMTQPPYVHVGRPIHELVETYREQCTQELSQHAKLTDSIFHPLKD